MSDRGLYIYANHAGTQVEVWAVATNRPGNTAVLTETRTLGFSLNTSRELP